MTDPQQPSGWSDPQQQQQPPVQPAYDPYSQGGYAVPPSSGTPAYGQPAYGQQPGYPQQPVSGYPAQPGYGQGYAQPMYVASKPTNGMAIASLVCSLAGLLVLVSAPVGAILGHIARKQIKETGEEGDGMALAGIIVGWVLTGLFVCSCVGLFILPFIFAGAAGAGSNF